MAGLAAMARLRNTSIPEVGTTTFRPPFVPQPLALYKGPDRGALFHPLKRLPLERAHREAGAALGDYGGWLRPGWYGAGEPRARAQSEARAARETAGLFDASPLGKIEVMGPDAAAFLDFICYTTVSTLAPGEVRYTFMLREDGVIFDDGVVARLGEAHFLVSCSSSHVDGVLAHLEAWRQDGRDPDRIFIHDATQGWTTLTVSGPDARLIVSTLALPLDLSAEAFPHMRLRQTTFAGRPARVARVSFTGDLSFEISVDHAHGPALWQQLQAAGAVPMGIEALSILRAEKGYIMVGKDTDGETMPHDLGFAGPRARKAAPYVGDRGLQSPAARRTDRQQLVGLRVPEDAPALPTGAHIVEGVRAARHSIGFVTSSYDSPSLGYPIALALMRGGQARHGDKVDLWHMGSLRLATVVPPVFFDPEGRRLHA
jgi:sarcosine oxidase subunit alpha